MALDLIVDPASDPKVPVAWLNRYKPLSCGDLSCYWREEGAVCAIYSDQMASYCGTTAYA